MREAVKQAALELLEYCRKENWAGYDPYDGLNSRLLRALPLSKSRIFRLGVTQALKRLPVNLRPLLLVPKSENPKACALFCSSLLRLSEAGILDDESLIRERLQRLLELRSPDRAEYCWGYHFDWQSRDLFLPRFAPNIICTAFAGNAVLDVYERLGERTLLDAATSAGEFLRSGLNITEDNGGICFSYTPFDRGQVHNANLLGAAFLARLFAVTGREEFRDLAGRATRFSLDRQNADGSWPYGEAVTQSWIDNFHTGFNLVALKGLSTVLHDAAIDSAIARGMEFYISRFFTADGVPKYFHDRPWPIDVHCAAQSIITLCELAGMCSEAAPLADKVCAWTLANMRSERGFFYYQKTRLYENHISYMRWSQAWMLYALAIYVGCRCG
jgi:hypothetical protein